MVMNGIKNFMMKEASALSSIFTNAVVSQKLEGVFVHIDHIVCCHLYFEASDVPCWMFITWINQMLAVLNKPEGKAVRAILHEIAQTYPQVS